MHRRVVRMSMETTTLDHTHRDIGLNTMIHYWKHRGLLLHRDFDFQIALHIIHSSFSINKHTIPGRFGQCCGYISSIWDVNRPYKNRNFTIDPFLYSKHIIIYDKKLLP